MGLGSLPWFERVTLGASGATLGLTLAAWTLMRFGAFSLGRALGIGAALCMAFAALVWLGSRRRCPTAERAPRESRLAWVALALCAAFGSLYAWFPTYFLLGGQDPGPYLAFAARIAKTGGLNLEVPAIAEWVRAHGPGLLRGFPAVYGNLAEPHGPEPLQAQFLHLFTAYDAIFFALGRVEGAVRANAWLATLCLATGFAFVRRLGSPLAAFGLLIALGLNPAFVWASRITLTEMLALWLNLSGLLLLVLAWDFASVAAGALAGAAFGLGVLNRLDGGLGSFALLGFAVASVLGERSERRVAIAAALGHLVVSALAYRDAYQLSPIYCRSLAEGSNSVTALPIVTSALDLLALGCAFAPARLVRALRVNETRVRLASYAAAWGGVLWVAYGLFMRPLVSSGEEARSLHELTWYVGWAAWPLFALGLALALRAATFERSLPLVAFALGTLVIYTSRTDVAPVHIWASRRWVPHVIPLVLAFAALAFEWLALRLRSKRGGVVGGFVLAALVLAPPVDFTRLFLFKSMLRGLAERYERVASFARRHGTASPLLTERVNYGSILTYVYDVPTAVLFGPGTEAFARGDFAGELGLGFHAFDLKRTVEEPGDYFGPDLEHSTAHRPGDVGEIRLPFELGRAGPRVFVAEMPASHPNLRTHVGRVDASGSVVAGGRRGQLLFGPWMTLMPGRYRIEWYGRIETAERRWRQGTLDVIFDAGNESIAEAPLAHTRAKGDLLGALDFELDQPIEGLEFRVRVEAKANVAITKLRLERFGDR